MTYKILHIDDPVVAARLLVLGIYPGKTIELLRRAPLGGACYVRVDQAFYALRRQEWDSILKQAVQEV